MVHQLSPTDSAGANGRRYNAVAAENVANRRFREDDAQFDELTGYLAIASAVILLSNAQNQGIEVSVDTWPTAFILVDTRPLALHQFVMPADDRARGKYPERVAHLVGRSIGSHFQPGRENS